MSSYATKPDLKHTTVVDTFQLAKKNDLASLKSDVDELDNDELKIVPNHLNNLKSKVDKIDVDKLATVSVDLKKLNDIVDSVVKKTKYIELVNMSMPIMLVTSLKKNKQIIVLRSKLMSIKYLVLLT